jgi:hypothetical protein
MVHDVEDDEEVTEWTCVNCTWTGNTMEEGSCNVCEAPKDPEDTLTFLQDQEQMRVAIETQEITRLRQKQTNWEQETAKWKQDKTNREELIRKHANERTKQMRLKGIPSQRVCFCLLAF